MYQFKGLDDTIVAIATPAGQGGIAIVRLSGPETFPIVNQLFKTKIGTRPSEFKSHTVHFGWIVKNDAVIDEALLTIMRAPRSYTKQDVAEISCHGGMIAAKSVLTFVCELGARLAQPGEFTKRAFLNGRIDLTQAEAVLDIIHSKTETFLRVSTNQLKGELSKELELIRNELLAIYVEIEAIVNFPEDKIDASEILQLSEKIKRAQNRVGCLLETSDQGRILKDGVKIVICGKPNVGKSSLLNVLLRTERAIVSAIAGTTRDTIEETAQIRGIPFQLVDTAGILEPRDLIEEEAIKRSQQSIRSADLILLVLDSSSPLEVQDERLCAAVKDQNVIVIGNKADLKICVRDDQIQRLLPGKFFLRVSVLTRFGFSELEQAIVDCVWHHKPTDTNHVLVSNVRHIQSLKECQSFLTNALQELDDKLSLEFISEEIKNAVNCLDSITGRNIDHDLLETIFSQFCIGK